MENRPRLKGKKAFNNSLLETNTCGEQRSEAQTYSSNNNNNVRCVLNEAANACQTHHICVPQGANVERHGGAEAGQHGEPEVSRG